MAEHNYSTQGPLSWYDPKTGKYKFAHSKDEQARIKEEGYTSAKYVKSMFPTTAWNRKTGETKTVGKLEWTPEQNNAAVAAIGDGWTMDHVPVPDLPPAPKPGAYTGSDLSALASIMADVKLMAKRMEDLEDAALQSDNIRVNLEKRISELEHELDETEPSAPSIPRNPPQVKATAKA